MKISSRTFKILMFAPYGYPPTTSEGIVTSKLLLCMLRRGWSVDLITENHGNAIYPSPKDDYFLAIMNCVHNVSELEAGRLKRQWYRIKCYYTGHGALPSQRFIWSYRALNLGLKLMNMNQYDVMISRSYPDYAHWPALVLSRIFRTPWVASWSDPSPAVKLPPPYGKGPDAEIPVAYQRYIREICNHADIHVFPSHRLMLYMRRILNGNDKIKTSVIPHVAIDYKGDKHIERKNCFSICHVGTLLPPRNSDAFFEGVRIFLQKRELEHPLLINFIGYQDNHQFPTTLKVGGNLAIITLKPPADYFTTLHEMQESDMLAIIEAPCEEGIFLPSKFIDYAQVGRPILAISPKKGTLSDLLTKHGGGIAVDCEDPQSVCQALIQFHDLWKTNELDSRYNSKQLFSLFSEDHVMNLYTQLFEEFASRVGK